MAKGSDRRAVLEKIAKARASAGGNYIRDGKYRFLVHRLLLEDKFSGTCFIAELEVVSAEAQFPDITPNQPGTMASYAVNLDGNGKQSAPGNIKAFVLALLGFEENEVSDGDVAEALDGLTSDAQPGRGMYIDTETWRKQARSGKNAELDEKGRGKLLMNSWAHVEQTEAEVAERRKQIDSK